MEDKKTAHTAPHLANRDAFEAALSDYHISDHAKQFLDHTKLVLLTGPSSAGRNTIIDHMLKSGKYHYIISDTTRPPRTNNGVLEQNGREYWFRNEEEMLQDIRDGEFLEAELIHGQQVSGISIRELEKATGEGRVPINEVDIGGIMNVLAIKPDTIALIILPPSFDEWQRRLHGRGEMAPDEFKRRMQTAVRIFDEAARGDSTYLIVNDTVMHAAHLIDQVVELGMQEVMAQGVHDATSQAHAKHLAADLLAQTKALLSSL